MEKKLVMVGTLLISTCVGLYGVGDRSTNTDGGSDTTASFYGTVETHEGNIYHINEITFNKLIKLIPVYEMPSEGSFGFDSSDINARILKKNPSQNLGITEFNLAGTRTISVPYPDVVWYYKKNQAAATCPIECSGTQRRYKLSEDSGATQYVQIRVTDKEGKQVNYLVEATKKIYAKEISASKAEEKVHVIKLPAIKTLTITGYHTRKEDQKECHCPQPAQEKKEEHTDGVQTLSITPPTKNSRSSEIKTSNHTKQLRSTKIVRAS